MQLRVKKLQSDAVLPKYAIPGDAGMDFVSYEDYVLKPGERYLFGTGIAIEIPAGFVGLIWDKSGLSNKKGLKVLGGVVDSGYRGEVKIGLVNLGSEEVVIEKGNKIAQMLIQKIESPEVVEANELSDAQRGEGGFGSTGE